MAVNPSALGPKPQFVDSAGNPAVGNKLFFYVAGSTSTKQNTYTDSTGASADANPIVLNALGEPTNQIWWTQGQSYKIVYAPSTDTDPPTSPIWTIDNLWGINDPVNSPANSEWIAFAGTPTFVSATSFTVAGNQTSTFQPGRRIQTSNTAGTAYSTIVTSAFTTLTTVTVVNDSTVLDSGLSAVSYGILSAINPSLPNAVKVRNIMGISENIAPITASVGSSALTLTLNPCSLNFRSATLGSGTTNQRSINTAISLVISSGSTLGSLSAIASRIAVIAIDNAGTVELAAVNLAGSANLDETTLITTTAEGGAGAADSASVIYSATARASVPFRVVGYVESTQATAGTWATAPSTIQGQGGQAITGLWQKSTSGTTLTTTSGTTAGFTGIPNWAKKITMNIRGVSLSGTDNYLIQIGAGSFTAAGYSGASVTLANTPAIAAAQFSTGFLLIGGGSNVVLEGVVTLTLLSSATNTWCCAINIGRSDAAIALTGGGSVVISGIVDRIQLLSSGANTFDAGSINITWE